MEYFHTYVIITLIKKLLWHIRTWMYCTAFYNFKEFSNNDFYNCYFYFYERPIIPPGSVMVERSPERDVASSNHSPVKPKTWKMAVHILSWAPSLFIYLFMNFYPDSLFSLRAISINQRGGCLVGVMWTTPVSKWGIKHTRTSYAGPSLITVQPEIWTEKASHPE